MGTPITMDTLQKKYYVMLKVIINILIINYIRRIISRITTKLKYFKSILLNTVNLQLDALLFHKNSTNLETIKDRWCSPCA